MDHNHGDRRADVQVSEAAAKMAGFAGADAVGPYMRTLISTHRDTLGPPVELEATRGE